MHICLGNIFAVIRMRNLEDAQRAMTELNAQNIKVEIYNQFRKIDFLFPSLSKSMREKMLLDDDAMFSVTDEKQADTITEMIKLFMPQAKSITDGCACCGGNVLSFSGLLSRSRDVHRRFEHVNAVEMDPVRHSYLEQNVLLAAQQNPNQPKRVSVYCGDYLTMVSQLQQDVIFLDPPWGGPGMMHDDLVRLDFAGQGLGSLCQQTFRSYAPFIVLKLPNNFDFKYFHEKLVTNAPNLPEEKDLKSSTSSTSSSSSSSSSTQTTDSTPASASTDPSYNPFAAAPSISSSSSSSSAAAQPTEAVSTPAPTPAQPLQTTRHRISKKKRGHSTSSHLGPADKKRRFEEGQTDNSAPPAPTRALPFICKVEFKKVTYLLLDFAVAISYSAFADNCQHVRQKYAGVKQLKFVKLFVLSETSVTWKELASQGNLHGRSGYHSNKRHHNNNNNDHRRQGGYRSANNSFSSRRGHNDSRGYDRNRDHRNRNRDRSRDRDRDRHRDKSRDAR